MGKERLITVKGIGSVTAPVDFIEINLTVEEKNKDYKKGYDSFEKRILDLQNIILNCGFSKNELKTSELTVYPEIDNVRKGNKYIEVFF